MMMMLTPALPSSIVYVVFLCWHAFHIVDPFLYDNEYKIRVNHPIIP